MSGNPKNKSSMWSGGSGPGKGSSSNPGKSNEPPKPPGKPPVKGSETAPEKKAPKKQTSGDSSSSDQRQDNRSKENPNTVRGSKKPVAEKDKPAGHPAKQSASSSRSQDQEGTKAQSQRANTQNKPKRGASQTLEASSSRSQSEDGNDDKKVREKSGRPQNKSGENKEATPVNALCDTTTALKTYLLDDDESPLYGGKQAESPEKKLLSNNPDKGKYGTEALCIFEHYNVPAEVRLEIYEYILNPEVVQYDPHNPPRGDYPARIHSSDYFHFQGRAHSWDFCLTLFAVNKSSREEAEAFFFHRNRLILIKFLQPRLKEYLHHAAIPIISDSELLRDCSTHAAYMEVDWEPCMRRDAQGNFNPPLEKSGKGHFLMMLEDFPKLCRLWKLVAQYQPTPGLYCFSGRGLTLNSRLAGFSGSPKVVFQLARPELFNHKERKALVGQLEQITGFGYDLTITSNDADDIITTPEFLKSLKVLMAPKLIWVHARELDRVNFAAELREEILAGDNLEQMYLRYKDFISFYGALREHDLKNFVGHGVIENNPEMNTVVRQGIGLDFHVHLDFGALCLRVEAEESEIQTWLDKCLNKLVFYLELNRRSSPVPIHRWPPLAKLQVLHLWILYRMNTHQNLPFDKFLPRIKSKYEKASKRPDQYAQSEHDLHLLAAFMNEANQPQPSPLVKDILKQTSLYKVGLWGFPLPALEPRGELTGTRAWSDDVALEALSFEGKQAIHEDEWRAAVHGAEFTQFEDTHQCIWCTMHDKTNHFLVPKTLDI